MPITDADALLRQGWEALRAADWQTARSCFEQALGEAESAEALDGLSQATHFLREYDRAIELKERAFAAYRQAADPVKAADTARWLAFLHGTYTGTTRSPADGWSAPAACSEGVDECAAHGWLVLDRAVFAASAADREKCAVSALAIARRFGDTDLEFDALALLGECYVATGRVAEGMRLLDEVMAAATGGEVTSHGAIGEICCRLLSACEHATDVRRAEQWMDLIRARWRGPTSWSPRAGRTTAASSWRWAGGRRPRPSCATPSRRSSVATAATARCRSCGWPTCACGRAATRRPSA